jgi:hypothetical protein
MATLFFLRSIELFPGRLANGGFPGNGSDLKREPRHGEVDARQKRG